MRRRPWSRVRFHTNPTAPESDPFRQGQAWGGPCLAGDGACAVPRKPPNPPSFIRSLHHPPPAQAVPGGVLPKVRLYGTNTLNATLTLATGAPPELKSKVRTST
jgi:hypothetical protein